MPMAWTLTLNHVTMFVKEHDTAGLHVETCFDFCDTYEAKIHDTMRLIIRC